MKFPSTVSRSITVAMMIIISVSGLSSAHAQQKSRGPEKSREDEKTSSPNHNDNPQDRSDHQADAILEHPSSLSNQRDSSVPGLIQHRSWHSRPDGRRVILVHGFGSRARSMSALAKRLEDDGFCVASFQYDSHRGVRGAAKSLRRCLARIQSDENSRQTPRGKIAIVTHSMGGLVTRWAIEQTESPPSNVDHLIMVAPPNAGSALASLTAASLIRRGGASKSLSASQRQIVANFDQTLSAMLGVGVGDLKPDSVVLRKLASAKIPAGLRYSILAGDAGPMPAETSGWAMAIKLAAAVARPPRPNAAGKSPADKPAEPDTPAEPTNGSVATVDKMINVAGDWLDLAGQPQWVAGQGDGVVSVASTRLVGVDDHAVLPFRHNTLTGSIESPGGERLVEAIEKRLREN